MTRNRHFRTVLLLAAALAAQGCETFAERGEPRPAARGAAPPGQPLAERTRLAPLDPNVFALADSQSVVGAPQIVYTREADTLSEIAREYGLGYDEIVEANPGIDPWLPGAGTPVLLPTQYVLPDAPREGIVLNIANKRLFYYPPPAADGARVVMTYPIGIGRVGWETPLGAASVVSKARDPHWWVPASVRREHEELGDPLPAVVPPGPDNPLGKYVLQLDMPGYLIHGTNMPYGVGMRVSHGCVRLYPENIETLYPLIAIGAGVTIVNQPYLAGWLHGELYFEGHRPLEDDAISTSEHLDRLLASLGERLDSASLEAVRLNAAAIASAGAGVPVRALRNDVDEIYERARVVRNTVEPDPEVPTLAEVRALLDAPLENLGEGDASDDGGDGEEAPSE